MPGPSSPAQNASFADAARRDDAEAGDGDPAAAPVHHQPILPATRSYA